jgi:hypoxanthine-DNA glycosylase
MKQGLPPIVWPHASILVLGSLPGDESLRVQQYYGNPRNQFWQILGRIYAEPISTEYSERIAFLQRHGIALWDVIQRAERQGSLDSNIRNELPNDFAALFRQAPDLRTIALNGSKAALSFERHVRPHFKPLLESVRTITLPSTSPVPARKFLSADAKAELWRAITPA